MEGRARLYLLRSAVPQTLPRQSSLHKFTLVWRNTGANMIDYCIFIWPKKCEMTFTIPPSVRYGVLSSFRMQKMPTIFNYWQITKGNATNSAVQKRCSKNSIRYNMHFKNRDCIHTSLIEYMNNNLSQQYLDKVLLKIDLDWLSELLNIQTINHVGQFLWTVKASKKT